MIFALKSINLDRHLVKNICIVYASAEELQNPASHYTVSLSCVLVHVYQPCIYMRTGVSMYVCVV